MEIVVCVKRVPDVAEAEVAIARDGRSLADTDVAWDLNEWDAFAVEEALRLREAHGGRVLAVTLGVEEDEEVLRRALAMGADEALHLRDEAFQGSDPLATAVALSRAIGRRPFDLVLTGAMSSDGANAETGGMLAALLGVPQVALATRVEVRAPGRLAVRHEVEGGVERIVELDLPAVVSVQTGINEPRYVSIRGIRKVAGVEIPALCAADLGLAPEETGEAGSRVVLEAMYLPSAGKRAEILEGDAEAVAAQLAERLRQKGGVR